MKQCFASPRATLELLSWMMGPTTHVVPVEVAKPIDDTISLISEADAFEEHFVGRHGPALRHVTLSVTQHGTG